MTTKKFPSLNELFGDALSEAPMSLGKSKPVQVKKVTPPKGRPKGMEDPGPRARVDKLWQVANEDYDGGVRPSQVLGFVRAATKAEAEKQARALYGNAFNAVWPARQGDVGQLRSNLERKIERLEADLEEARATLAGLEGLPE